MERYLKLENLQFALGSVADVPTLPSAEELQEMIGRAEVLMFIKQKRIPQELITIGWYLHSIASSRKSLEVYDVLRMRRAHQVSSHIFDLVLQNGVEDKTEVLSYMFAAQVGYIKGDLNPNAVAVYKNFNINNELSILVNHKDIALKLGVMLLALDRAELFKVLQKLRAEVHDLVDDTNNNLTPIVGIINSVWNLLLYLTYGYEDARTKASALLEQIVRNPSTTGDVNTRWVAAHLLDITDEFEKSSLWSVVPPEIPRNAIKAMTLGSPPILSLWPPQLELLGSDHSNSPLLLSTKRLLLSVPTSAGKTLLAQLFILSHLAQGGKGVCFIAPSHSLCREIQDSLASRLRFMNYNVAGSYPENMEEFNNNSADIEVMTPERFSFMLRNDIQRMLNDFSLFIIDEAHLISEQSRGLGLETSLSLVKLLTRSSPHRIFLMSAALGKEGHIHEWMQESEGSRSFHSEWRGPRRLYAMYSSEIDTSLRSETIPATTRRNYELKKYRLKGTVRLRIADTDQIHKVSLSTLVGELYLKRSFDGMVRHTLSTTQNRMLVPLIISVAESGPVLVIESTRAQAQDMAKYIAEQIAEDYEGASLIGEFVKLRLGEEHSLYKVIKKGVAYHHAALPSDVQDAIEVGVKSGSIKYIISTTTLVDGINLPVRTVVIGQIGMFRNNGEFEETIKGAKLINAIGRAGRAAKESEGWIILSGKYDSQRLLSLMQTNYEDMIIQSEMATAEALSELEQYETLMQTSEDAIFEIANTKVSDFVSYVWFVVSSIEALKKQITLEDLNSYLSSTLAWRQLDEVTKFRWSGVAKQALVKYTSTDPDKRKKWAKSGTSLSSNRRLDVVSRQLFDTILTIFIEEERYLNYEEMIELVFSDDYLSVLLNLPEAPKSGFRSRRNAPQDDVIEVDIKQLLLDWISGQDLNTLVNKHLKEISNVEYAYESLGDYLTSTFENYLPWVVGTVISWINNYPQAFTEGRNLVSPYFSAYIRYGVNNHVAVDLMVHGIRSRQLALALSTDYGFASEEGYDLKSWLQTLRIDDLVARYNASSSEINDFIKYINPDDSTFLADLIENQHAAISIYGLNCRSASSARLTKATSDNGNMSIFVTDNSGILFELPIQYHRDISSLLDTGLPHTVSVDCNDEITDITIEFIDFSQDV